MRLLDVPSVSHHRALVRGEKGGLVHPQAPLLLDRPMQNVVDHSQTTSSIGPHGYLSGGLAAGQPGVLQEIPPWDGAASWGLPETCRPTWVRVEVSQHQGIHATTGGHDAKGPCEEAPHYVQVLVRWERDHRRQDVSSPTPIHHGYAPPTGVHLPPHFQLSGVPPHQHPHPGCRMCRLGEGGPVHGMDHHLGR